MINSEIQNEDYAKICECSFIPWDDLKNKSILITGGTGLVGCNLINALCYVNKERNLGIVLHALVRNVSYAQTRFSQCLYDVHLIEGTVEFPPSFDFPIDYIIHGASPTKSAYFVNKPVETISTIFDGTRNMLSIGKKAGVDGFLFLSSMEVYGSIDSIEPIKEHTYSKLDPLVIRNSYPAAKRMCENLCASYYSEYGVPTRIIRLAQTFGPGSSGSDQRVFKYFADSVVNKRDIILKTRGESRHTYLYTADAVTAILTVLLKGESCEAYNAGNPETFCSIYEMAEMVASKIAGNTIEVRISKDNSKTSVYPSEHAYNLSVDKLRQLGWTPTYGLYEMYRRMIASDNQDIIM